MGPDEKVSVAEVYDVKTGPRKRKRRNKQPDKWFPYLRSGAVNAAIDDMKNRNHYPEHVRKQDMPGKKGSWNNFTEVRPNYLIYTTY